MKSLIWTIWNRWIHRERRVMVAQGRVKEGWLLSGHKGWPCLGARQRWWCTCSKCTDPTELGHTFVIVQSLCRVQLFVTSWVAVHQASLSFTISQSLPKFISIESLMPSNHLLLCRQLLLPSIFPSIRVFSNEATLHIRGPKYRSLSFSISPFNEYSGLISFRIYWFDLLAVQGILKSLLQHHSLKASVLQHSAFFIIQLSHLYMSTRKTIALTIPTFVCKVTSLLLICCLRLS